ncbi:hypothetical protein [Streptomyces sp. NPDC000229]|uniref:hypothetical protein n=1 Tax=Streptomyces sp. NPDC000229 TaxID=3154247 RepID=UPI00331B483F
MHGHGYAPPQPPGATPASLIALRVIFAMLPLCSCGLLAWGTALRLALVTRRPRDWALFAIVLAGSIAGLVTVMSDPTEDLSMPRSDIAIGSLLLMAAMVMGYYLYAETRHFSASQAPFAASFAPPSPIAPTHPMHGYPPGARTAPAYEHPAPPVAAPRPVAPPSDPRFTPQPQPTPPPQPPAKPTSQRIDQVRAELDELSDLLRNEPRDPREEGR